MKLGKISESVLKRTIIKEIKYKRKDVKKGSSVGNDAAVYEKKDAEPVTTIASYSGDFLLSAKRAFFAAVNSMCAKGAEPVGAMVSIMMSETQKESQLRAVMVALDELAAKLNVQITGGHTETTDKIQNPVVTVTAFGYMTKPYAEGVIKDYAGLDVVMIGEAGLEGTAVLAIEKEEELKKRFTGRYIQAAKRCVEELDIKSEAAVAVQHGGIAMHDTSKGGVFAAIWELSEYLKCGMNVDLKTIPIRQETIEFCEYFDMNPYFICSQGGLLVVTKNGELLVDKIRKTGKVAALIGHTTVGCEKAIINNDEKRFLEPPKAGKKEYSI